jgi:hypothetical protein
MSTKIPHNTSLLKKNQEERIEETMTVTTSSRDVEKWKKGARVRGGRGRRIGEVKDEDGSRVPSKVTENGEF